MGIEGKNAKWRILNSLHLLAAPIPVLNSLCLVYMYARVKNKKWFIMVWITLIVSIALIFSSRYVGSIVYDDLYDVPIEPMLTDYISLNEQEEYLKTHTRKEMKELDEYKQYEKALDDFLNDEDIQNKTIENAQHRGTMQGVQTALETSLTIYTVFVFFYIVSQNYTFLNKLAQSETAPALKYGDGGKPADRIQDVEAISDQAQSVQNIPEMEQLLGGASNQNNIAQQPAEPEESVIEPVIQPQTQIQKTEPASETDMLDINKASEEEFANLPGLTVVDAKRAINARENNGKFNTKDEFYAAINIKPHILVKIDDLIVVGQDTGSTANTPTAHKSRRQIDL